MTNEFLNRIEEFFDIVDALKVAYYENMRLRQENKELKERLDEHRKQIMRMAAMSEQGVRNWINAIMDGKIKLENE